MKRKKCLLGKDVFTVESFLSNEECLELISTGEEIGFEPATVHTELGHEELPDWRNNTRVTIDDPERASQLWETAKVFIPQEIDGWEPVGINERLRFYRYDPGQRFDWHTDGFFRRENGERSFLTFMIYLNGGFSGGETSFRDDDLEPLDFEAFSVVPETGTALFFTHWLLHKGEPVNEGRKYVLRTDVMFENRRF